MGDDLMTEWQCQIKREGDVNVNQIPFRCFHYATRYPELLASAPLLQPLPFGRKHLTMSIESCTQAIRAKVGDDSGLNATLKFDCGADGLIFIDGSSTPNTVSNADMQADCTVGITLENLTAMLAGELDPVTGFMGGKLKVSGDMSVAMRLQRVV
jgi:putative sterol carrier protein